MFSFTFLEKLRKNIPRSVREGWQRRWRCYEIRGIFSRVREYPPWTPKRTRGEDPSPPNIAGLGLEELHALRNVSAVYMASP